MDRADELAAIDRFLADRGASRCPAKYADSVAGALPLAEEARRLAGFEVPRLTREQQIEEWLNRIWRWRRPRAS